MGVRNSERAGFNCRLPVLVASRETVIANALLPRQAVFGGQAPLHIARGSEDGLMIALLVHSAGGQDRDAIGADERVVIIPVTGRLRALPGALAAIDVGALSLVAPLFAPVLLHERPLDGAVFIDYAHHQGMLQYN